MAETLLEIEHLDAGYNDVAVVRNLNLHVDALDPQVVARDPQ